MLNRRRNYIVVAILSLFLFYNGFLSPRLEPGAKETYETAKMTYNLLHSGGYEPEYMTTIEDFDIKYFVEGLNLQDVWYYYTDRDEDKDSKSRAKIRLDIRNKSDGAASLRIDFKVDVRSNSYVGVGTTFADVQNWVNSDKELRFYIKASKAGIHLTYSFLVTDPNQHSVGELGLALFQYKYVTTEDDVKKFNEVKVKFSDLKLAPKYQGYASVTRFTGKDVETMDFGFKKGESGTVWIDSIKLKSKIDLNKLNEKLTLVMNPIKVNQAGYTPEEKKVIIATVEADSFEVLKISKATNGDEIRKKVYNGILNYVGYSKDSGDDLYVGDFSSVTGLGEYRIQVGTNVSYKFKIMENPYKKPLYLVGHAIHTWRCGKVNEPSLGYNNPGCHLDDGYYWENHNKHKDVTGGWHDAADYGKYVPTAASAVSALMITYEFNKEKLKDLKLGLNDSTEKRPDILTEVLWELKWLLKMQEPNGGVHHKITPQAYGDTMLPWKEKKKRYIFRITSSSTAYFCGAMAMAARIYKETDPDWAEKFKEAAIRAWKWLKKHPNQVPPGGFKNPPGCEEAGGEYNVDSDRGNRYFAAAAIYRLTGDRSAKQYLFDHFYQSNEKNHEMFWAAAYPFGVFEILYNKKADRKLVKMAEDVLRSDMDLLLSLTKKSKWGVLAYGRFSRWAWIWGSHELIAGRGLYMCLGSKYLKDNSLYTAAKKSIDYIMGINPYAYVYITRFGEHPYSHPHHGPSLVLHKPFPGLLAEGPNAAVGDSGGDRAVEKLWKAKLPPMKCYIDDPESWSTNEPTVGGNAIFFAFLSFYLR